MKTLRPLVCAAVACINLTLPAAEKTPPGQVDFGAFAPANNGGEYVEVNITSSLISLAASFVEKEDAEIAKLLNGLQAVRVNVVGLTEANRSEMLDRVRTVREQLNSKGWERIVSAQQKDQDVGVYLKTENKDTVQGLTVVVLDGDKEAVFVNVVGNIRPEQLSKVAERLNIQPLKKLAPERTQH